MLFKNKLIVRIILLFFLTACSEEKNKSHLSKIYGEIKNCEGCEVELIFRDYSKFQFQDIGKTIVKNGKISFTEQIKQPGIYKVFYKDIQAKSFFSAEFYLPADTVQIVFDKNRRVPKFYEAPIAYSQLQYAEVKSTSPIQKEFNKYLQLSDSLTFNFYLDRELLKAKFEQTFDSGNKALIDQWADSVRMFENKFGDYLAKASELFVQRHPNSEIALYVILDGNLSTQAQKYFRPYYASLPEERQNSFYGKILGDWIKRNGKREKNNQQLIGNRVSYLAGTTPNQKKLDAANIFKQNKLTLVEFWASWCSPCRWEMPKYHELYKKYHADGFDMIAVSIDDDYKKWTKAIAEDSIYVQHISELKGANGQDVRRFNVQLIPFNLLVDASGKVIAADLNSDELKTILQKKL